jgi:D-aminoacyl-tRNA deacylase
MKYLLVASRIDPAGLGIARYLLENYPFREAGVIGEAPLYTWQEVGLTYTGRDIIYADHLDHHFTPETYIFLSRHSSASGRPTLSSHFTGNFGPTADFGGRPRELAYTCPSLQREYMVRLVEEARGLEEYEVVLEATHHGPTSLKRPLLFVEIGSSETEWRDPKAHRAVGEALIEALQGVRPVEGVGVAFGGTHYPQKFTELLVEGSYALGAIAAKYALPHLDEGMVGQMIDKAAEKVRLGVVDWKGLGPYKQRVLELIKEAGLELVRV